MLTSLSRILRGDGTSQPTSSTTSGSERHHELQLASEVIERAMQFNAQEEGRLDSRARCGSLSRRTRTANAAGSSGLPATFMSGTGGMLTMMTLAYLPPEAASDTLSTKSSSLTQRTRPMSIEPLSRSSDDGLLSADLRQAMPRDTRARPSLSHTPGDVFTTETLCEDVSMLARSSSASPSRRWSFNDGFTGDVTCSASFESMDGPALAIGCDEGLWVGFRRDSRSLRRVPHLRKVTQCVALQELRLLLVCAEKTLHAFHIDSFLPLTNSFDTSQAVFQTLGGIGSVDFVRVGRLKSRTLVAFASNRQGRCHIRIVEPVMDKFLDSPISPGGARQRQDCFRPFQKLSVEGDARDVTFLKASVVVISQRGFEIMKLADPSNNALLPVTDSPHLSKLAEPLDTHKALGMFRSTEDDLKTDAEFILCYDTFGIYISNHGHPLRAPIAWEMTAACVAYRAPYLLLFSSDGIEVRRLRSGRHVQTLRPGHDVRCICDGDEGRASVHVVTRAAGISSSASSESESLQILDLICVPPYAEDPLRTADPVGLHAEEQPTQTPCVPAVQFRRQPVPMSSRQQARD